MRDAWAHLVHDPDHLMPGNQRQLGRRQLAFDDMQIGVAHAAPHDPQPYFARARHRGRQVAPLQRPGLHRLGSGQHHGVHEAHSFPVEPSGNRRMRPPVSELPRT
jgi:hypothetical protein